MSPGDSREPPLPDAFPAWLDGAAREAGFSPYTHPISGKDGYQLLVEGRSAASIFLSRRGDFAGPVFYATNPDGRGYAWSEPVAGVASIREFTDRALIEIPRARESADLPQTSDTAPRPEPKTPSRSAEPPRIAEAPLIVRQEPERHVSSNDYATALSRLIDIEQNKWANRGEIDRLRRALMFPGSIAGSMDAAIRTVAKIYESQGTAN